MLKKDNLKTTSGSVLVVVMITVAFLMTVVVFLFEKTNRTYYNVVNLQVENQGSVYATTALTAIKALMEYDDADFDGFTDQWIAIPSIPVEGGSIAVKLLPIDDRLPINALIDKDEAVRTRVRDAFSKVYSDLGYTDDLWLSLVDWIDADSDSASSSTEDTVFNESGSSYSTKNAKFDTLYEVRLLPEYPEMFNDIKSYISINSKSVININFADNLTIKAFLPELEPFLDQINEKRYSEPFKKKDDLYLLMGTHNQSIYQAVLPFFDVKSTLFYAKIEVNIFGETRYYHALMERNGKRFSILSYIEGTSMDYY